MRKEQIKEFIKKLGEKCDVIIDKKGKTKWTCHNDHRMSYAILKEMKCGKKEANKFIKLCEYYGGYCDCEILFNAVGRLLR